MSQALLQQAITAVKGGRNLEARHLLEQVVQTNPHLEQGWLWLSAAVETAEERRFCLSQVLSINPSNVPAQRGLAALGPGAMQSPLDGRPGQTESKNESLSVIPDVKTKDLSQPKPLLSQTGSSEPLSHLTCPRCQAANPPHFAYCDQCGAALTRPAPTKTSSDFIIKPLPVKAAAPSVSKLPRPTRPIERQPARIEQLEGSKGKGISMVATMVVLVCFFLPWITVSCSSYGLLGQDYNQTWSGYELASDGIRLASGVSTNDTQWLYTIPITAALAFLILLFSGRKRIRGGTATIIIVLAVIGGGILASVYTSVSGEVKEFVRSVREVSAAADYKLELGFWGTILGIVGMALGAIADVVKRDT